MSLASDPGPGCCFGTAWAVGQESWSPPCPEPGASGRSLLCGMRTLCRELGELRGGGGGQKLREDTHVPQRTFLLPLCE